MQERYTYSSKDETPIFLPSRPIAPSPNNGAAGESFEAAVRAGGKRGRNVVGHCSRASQSNFRKFLYSNAELYIHSSTSSHGSLSETCSSVLFQEAMESDAEAGTQCSPLTKATLGSSFSASSFTDCDVEFSASISSPHLARLDYPISRHSPQALLSPVFRKCFTDSINPTFVTCCISSIGPSARLLWEGDWLTVGSHGSM